MSAGIRAPWEFESPSCAGLGLDTFYVEDEENPRVYVHIKTVVKMCESCVHKIECAEWGINKERWGIWGGLTPKQRENIRRSRRRSNNYKLFELLP